MSNTIDTQAQKEMQEALDRYKKDKNSVKEFYPCSQELTKRLEEKVKS
jgi:hypothetical protein